MFPYERTTRDSQRNESFTFILLRTGRVSWNTLSLLFSPRPLLKLNDKSRNSGSESRWRNWRMERPYDREVKWVGPSERSLLSRRVSYPRPQSDDPQRVTEIRMVDTLESVQLSGETRSQQSRLSPLFCLGWSSQRHSITYFTWTVSWMLCK